MKRTTSMSLLIVCLALSTSFAHAGIKVLHEQPLNPEDPGIFTIAGSLIVADGFAIIIISPTDLGITSVHWYGVYQDGDLDPSITSHSFLIQFYDGDLSLPVNEPRFSQQVRASVQDSGFRVLTGFFAGHTIYEYEASLKPFFNLPPFKKAWIAIQHMQSELGQWLWSWGARGSRPTVAIRSTLRDFWRLPSIGGRTLAYSVSGAPIKIVEVDIRPETDENVINLRSSGVLPVAILSTTTFDASVKVDPETIVLGGARAKIVGKGGKSLCHPEDVNADSLDDLVCHLAIAELVIEPGESIARLEGCMFDGTPIQGEDLIRTIPEGDVLGTHELETTW